MKRLTLVSMFVISVLLFSACSMHTGLGSVLNSSPTKVAKKVKATHTPPSPSKPGAENTITITATAFTPNAMQVSAGTTVTWINTDTVQHTVTSDTNLFDSGPIDPGGKFTYTFAQAGSFAFHDTKVTTLTGSVTVQ